jgi:hypothetical protein
MDCDMKMPRQIKKCASISRRDEEQDMESIETFAGTIAAQQNVTKQQAKE